MSTAPPRSIAFIGLGQMGLPMATRLVEAGHRVIGIDPVPEALQHAADRGMETSSDVAAAAAAEVVVLMLPDSNVVDAVTDQILGLTGDRAIRTIVDMSSSDPVRTRALASTVESAGIALVDAPVSGGVPRAVTGELAIMVGGEEAAIEPVRPILESLGTYVRRVGPVGCGHAVKALNNLLSATHLLASNEAALVAARFGVEPETFVAVVNASSGRSGSTEVKLPRYILPRTFDSGFRADLLEKDVKIALSVAATTGVTTPVTSSAGTRWAELNQRLERGADHTAIAQPAEAEAGVELRGSAS